MNIDVVIKCICGLHQSIKSSKDYVLMSTQNKPKRPFKLVYGKPGCGFSASDVSVIGGKFEGL